MSLIKIVAKDIELDFVKETLSIKKENNALSRDFSVAHSSFPFLIIENKKAKQALGTRELSSINKIKTIEVTVFEGGKKYLGELQVLSYLSGFRKCNLKYASDLLSIMNTKIADFMPTVSVIPGETAPVPYLETTDIPVTGSDNWATYPLGFINNIFPAVKWQFPTMKHFNKFGVDLAVDDPWHSYENEINKFGLTEFVENTYEVVSNVCTVLNKNIPAPQLFLLTPLFYALETIGWKMSGSFTTSEFIKRLLILNNKNNLTKSFPLKTTGTVTLNAPTIGGAYDDLGELIYYYYSSLTYYVASVAGVYYFNYEITEPTFTFDDPYVDRKYFYIALGDQSFIAYTHYSTTAANVYKGTIKIEVTAAEVGQNIRIGYFTNVDSLPTYSLGVKVTYPNEYNQMHPTINLSRYTPDWTFATYLNALQNFFNLEITPDDFTKKLTLNFNADSIINGEKTILNKSLIASSYEQTPYNSFLLKYANDEDAALWITTEGAVIYTTQKSDFLEKLDSKFKLVPTTATATLSEELDSKEGIGLMIYDTFNKPNTSSNYLGQNLNLDGVGGVYEVYWRKWLKFRLNSSILEMSGPFTEIELNKIIKLNRIFIDNQEYMISSLQYSETTQNNFDVKFSLLSITF
jgi:hypothetical protein